MVYPKHELDWALVNEQPTLKLVGQHMDWVLGNCSVQVNYTEPLIKTAREIKGDIYQALPLSETALNLHDAEIFFGKGNKDGYHISGDAVISDTTIKNAAKISTSKLLFSGDKVIVSSTSIVQAPMLSITLNAQQCGGCFLKINSGTLLSVIGELEIKVKGWCDIIIAGTLEASSLKIHSAVGNATIGWPRLFVLDGGKISGIYESSAISRMMVINYGEVDFSNVAFNNVRITNTGVMTLAHSNICLTSFLNSENAITSLSSGTNLVLKESLVNFGLIGTYGEVLILNSWVCKQQVVDEAKASGNALHYKNGGVFYNHGRILTSESNNLLHISNFQLVINGLSAEMHARLNIHTAREAECNDAIFNVGGRIYLHKDSNLATHVLCNSAVNPRLQSAPAYIIFKGPSNLDIGELVYNIESYFGGGPGIAINFVHEVKRIECVAQGKPCRFEGAMIGSGNVMARDIADRSNRVLQIPVEDDRAKRLSSSKIIPLHEMADDISLETFNSLKLPPAEEFLPGTDEDDCVRQFSYVIRAHKNMPAYYPGLAELLCQMSFHTSYKKQILFDGYRLEQFLQKYELMIFGVSLDMHPSISSPMQKMEALISSAVKEQEQHPAFELLKPLPIDFSPIYPMLWPVEIQTKQGANIIVPYLYLPKDFKKEDGLVAIKFLPGSQFLITGGGMTKGAKITVSGGKAKAKAIAYKDTDNAESLVPCVTFKNTFTIPEGSEICLESGYVLVEGSLINKGLITSLSFSLLEAKTSIINFGSITGENLALRTKSLMMEVLVGNMFETEYSNQIMAATQDPEFRILDKRKQKIKSMPKVDLSGVFIVEADDVVKIEAARIKARKIGIRSRGKIFIMPIGLYEKVSNWWGSGSFEREQLNFLVTEFQGQNIEITSEDGILILSTKFLGDTFIKAKKQLLIDVVSNMESTRRIEIRTKRSWFRKKVTTIEEFRQEVTPIYNEFFGSTSLEGEGGLKLVGIQVDNSQTNRISAGTKDKPASVELLPATKVLMYDIKTRTKKSFLCFNIGKASFQEKGLMRHNVINVVKSEKGFYGHSHGNWLQLATRIEANEIYIYAKENVILGSAQDITYVESHLKKAGLASWFDASARGVSVGVGWRHKENHMRKVDITSVPNILIAGNTKIESETGMAYLVGIFNNTGTFTVQADKVDFGVGENEQYISASALSYQIGINAGIKFGRGGASEPLKNLGKQKTSTTIDKLNTAFAAVQTYTAVGELLANVAKGGAGGFSAGAWVSFNIQSSQDKIEQKTVTPTIINARHIVIKANDVHMKALQMFAFDVYLKALRLHIEPAEISLKRESSGKNFGFSMGLDFSKILGEKTAQKIENALSKLKVGTLPVSSPLLSFALKSGNTHQIRHVSTTIHVSGTLKIEVKLDATIKGADIIAGTLIASFDALILESVRDIMKNKEWTASVGFSDDARTKLESFSSNYKSEDGLIVSQITQLIGIESATVVVARALHLNGAMIANAEVDANGHYTDKGNLTLEVGDLFAKYLHTHDDGTMYGAACNFLNKYTTKNAGEGKKPNAIGYHFSPEFGYKSHEGKVLATIGLGRVTIHGSQHGDPLNRDLNAASTLKQLSPMESIKAYFSSETPSPEEFTDDFKGAATRLGEELQDIGQKLSNWLDELLLKNTMQSIDGAYTEAFEINQEEESSDYEQSEDKTGDKSESESSVRYAKHIEKLKYSLTKFFEKNGKALEKITQEIQEYKGYKQYLRKAGYENRCLSVVILTHTLQQTYPRIQTEKAFYKALEYVLQAEIRMPMRLHPISAAIPLSFAKTGFRIGRGIASAGIALAAELIIEYLATRTLEDWRTMASILNDAMGNIAGLDDANEMSYLKSHSVPTSKKMKVEEAGGGSIMPDPEDNDKSDESFAKIIDETAAKRGRFTSKYELTETNALELGRKWLGNGYKEVGRAGSGVYRSADGLKQFRIDITSIKGSHQPYKPHFHLERLDVHGNIISNNHILLKGIK